MLTSVGVVRVVEVSSFSAAVPVEAVGTEVGAGTDEARRDVGQEGKMSVGWERPAGVG